MNNDYAIGSQSYKSFPAYPDTDFDIESGTPPIIKRIRKPKSSRALHLYKMIPKLHHFFKLHPLVALLLLAFSFGVTLMVFLSYNRTHLKEYDRIDPGLDEYPFSKLRNMVMVAGHSVYTSSGCGKIEKEDSWILESYQKNPGQAATFVKHIEEGIEIVDKDESALLLFSGGETRKDAGPRSEAQSYWAVADFKGWFGKEESVKWRSLTEEHARDSFENLLFSVCRFRELTGTYPQNITVVSYDFKESRFANLHRSAIGFPESRFFYAGTPATTNTVAAALKGEELVRTQFLRDPYGCRGSLYHKKLKRDPFHRSIPYPKGCPEMQALFRYCGPAPYPGALPWA
ncbi:uncharacterized protein C57A10.07 [Lathyrus oleraceus]|uniref:DUF218 domain-containing protein n=1 Tax=Pisum sativum TaxID=3888 RepID=A0A9D4W380_PEA|nr:uncharacterized protein C57A10.07 [Pisum sativum]KAI5394302.1 hypothetical protein KIW84_061115 [Pisum sativum]